MEHTAHGLQLPLFLLLAVMVILGFYFGRNMKHMRLPSIIGFMIFGVVLGPSLFNLLNEHIQTNLSFLTEIALGFVALSIGLELRFASLKKLGVGIIYIILVESFAAFVFVFFGIWALTGNLP
ncbi:cation:proton antiporter, partial [bacterium]|nr:cation:proton antiporter [bacterium]